MTARLSIASRIWLLVAVVAAMSLIVFGVAIWKADALTQKAVDETTAIATLEDEVQLKALAQSTAAMIGAAVRDIEDETERREITRALLQDTLYFANNWEENQSGYYFVYTFEGICIAHPIKPHLNDTDVWNFQDPDGTYLFREMSKAAQAGGDFVPYAWEKPGDDFTSPKLSYAAAIPNTEWYVGTGVYTDDVASEAARIQEEFAATAGAANRATIAFTLGYLVLVVAPFVYIIAQRSIVRPLRGVVRRMADIAEGEGDLTQRLRERGNDELSELCKSFNKFIIRIESAICNVASAADTVSRSSSEIAASSAELASTTEAQSDRARDTINAVSELAESTGRIVECSNNCAESARAAKEAAGLGKDAVESTITGIASIQEASSFASQSVGSLGELGEQIGAILEVINDIADQTNLLALNAAIEAARAGEHGRGFAVVADEVRKLAERTTGATGEISETISTIQSETDTAIAHMRTGTSAIESGTESAMDAGDRLHNIVNTTDTAVSSIQEIASLADQQNHASDNAMHATERIQATVVESSAAAEQCAATAENLRSEAQNLSSLVAQFRYGSPDEAKAE